MEWKCMVCGAENPENEEWCSYCGASKEQDLVAGVVQPEPIPDDVKTTPEPQEGERDVYPETIEFSGNVSDETQRPVENASITLSPVQDTGTAINTESDSLGSFKVAVEPGGYSLVVEKMGYQEYNTSITISKKMSHSVTLHEFIKDKDEPIESGEDNVDIISEKDSPTVKITIVSNPVQDYNGEEFQYKIADVFNEISIGRLPTNLITLLDGEVSRHHAKIVYENGVVSLVDTGSKNRTYVYDQQSKLFSPIDKTELKGANLVKFANKTLVRIEIL